jgi:hypothetical protein
MYDYLKVIDRCVWLRFCKQISDSDVAWVDTVEEEAFLGCV